jgi:hypothetical protein
MANADGKKSPSASGNRGAIITHSKQKVWRTAGEFPAAHGFQFEFLLPHQTRRLHSARFRHPETVAFYFPLKQLSVCEDF